MPASLLLSLVLLSPSVSEDLAARSERGKQLMAAGRYAEAVPVYRALAEALPDNPGLLLNLGMALHLAGRDREAIAPLESALRRQPDLGPAGLFLGLAHLGLGRPADAVGPLQRAVRLLPGNRDARAVLAEALLALGRYAEAEPHLNRMGELAPVDPAVWLSLGNTYEELAGQALDEIARRAPQASYGPALAAEARLKEGRDAAAFRLYRQALQAGPPLHGLHAAVAAIYRRAGHGEWAAIEEARERRLAPAECTRPTLECRFTAGRHRDVIAAASPETAEAHYWRGRASQELAARAFARLAALPPSPQSHERAARVHRAARRHRESADEWRQALAGSPGDLRLQVELALALRLDRDFAAAQKVLEEALRASPDAHEPNDLLGDVLLARQEPERALPFLEKALRLGPGEPHTHGAIGRAYALVGRPQDAVRHLEQALPADEDGSLRYQLARSYQALGREEQARTALADYETFKKTLAPDLEAAGQEPPLTPP